jgi:hypothetical protein
MGETKLKSLTARQVPAYSESHRPNGEDVGGIINEIEGPPSFAASPWETAPPRRKLG